MAETVLTNKMLAEFRDACMAEEYHMNVPFIVSQAHADAVERVFGPHIRKQFQVWRTSGCCETRTYGDDM